MDLESNDNLGDKIISKSLGQYVFFFLLAPSGYIIKLLLTNALSVSDFGLLYAIINLMGLISIYNDLGLTECLQYFIPQYAVAKDRQRIFSLIGFTFITQLVTGVLIIAGLYRGADWIATQYFHDEAATDLIHIFCRYFGFLNIIQVCSSLFMAYQKPFYQSITELVKMSSIIAFIIAIARFDTITLTIAAYSWIIGMGMGMITALIIVISKYKHIFLGQAFTVRKSDIKIRLKYAVWVFIGANIATLFGQVDQLIIVSLGGTEQAGFFSAYLSLNTIYGAIMQPLAVLLYPLMTQLITEKDDEKLSSLLKLLYKVFFVSALIFAIIFSIYGRDIAIILFGQKFAYSGELAQRGALIQLLGAINRITFTLYAARGAVKQRVHIVAEGLLINIFTIWGGYHRRGLYGCLIGFAISMFYIAIRTQWILHSQWHFHRLLDRGFIAKNILASLIVGGLLRSLSQALTLPIHRVRGGLTIAAIGLGVCGCIAAVNRSYMKVMRGLVKQKLPRSTRA